MSEDQEPYTAGELGWCDACLWYGDQVPAVRAMGNMKYPHSYMDEVPMKSDATKFRRGRVVGMYHLCATHCAIAHEESAEASMRAHRKDCDKFVVESGQLQLLPE